MVIVHVRQHGQTTKMIWAYWQATHACQTSLKSEHVKALKLLWPTLHFGGHFATPLLSTGFAPRDFFGGLDVLYTPAGPPPSPQKPRPPPFDLIKYTYFINYGQMQKYFEKTTSSRSSYISQQSKYEISCGLIAIPKRYTHVSGQTDGRTDFSKIR